MPLAQTPLPAAGRLDKYQGFVPQVAALPVAAGNGRAE